MFNKKVFLLYALSKIDIVFSETWKFYEIHFIFQWEDVRRMVFFINSTPYHIIMVSSDRTERTNPYFWDMNLAGFVHKESWIFRKHERSSRKLNFEFGIFPLDNLNIQIQISSCNFMNFQHKRRFHVEMVWPSKEIYELCKKYKL